MKQNRRYLFLGLLFFILIGCQQEPKKSDYLLKVGQSSILPIDFKKSFEIAKIAYPYKVLRDKSQCTIIKNRLLKQITQRLILFERARELKISLSPQEFDTAIRKAKEGYTQTEFEQTLLESAINYEQWKKELKFRLLMEKVITRDLKKSIVLTPEEIASYRQKLKQKNRQLSPDLIEQHLQERKIKAAYQPWFQSLHQKYSIDLNKALWLKIINS